MAAIHYTTIDGEIIAEDRNGVRKHYLPGPLGSTVGLVDNTQTITDTYAYFPYGQVSQRSGSTPTPFQFVGTLGYYNDNTTVAYVRARQLDMARARWMTQDPIGFAGSDWNLYRYAGSRPTGTSDRSGLAGGPPPKPKPRNCAADRQACLTVCGLTYAGCMAIVGAALAAAIAVCNIDPEPITKEACIEAAWNAARTRFIACSVALGACIGYCWQGYKQCVASGGNP